MSNKTQIDTDAQALEYLREKVRETEWNADIAREAIRIAERYRRKADNQRMMLNQLQKGGGSERIDKRVVQDALLERISRLNAEGEKSVNVARELIRFKRFVDGLTPFADPKTGEWIFNPKDAIELMFTKPKCSECGFESADGGNFCSNCGKKMRGKEE